MQISSNINRVTKFGYVGSLVGCASVGGVLVLCFYYWNVLLSTHNYICICHLLKYHTGLCALYYNSVYCNFCFYVRVTITIVLFAIRYTDTFFFEYLDFLDRLLLCSLVLKHIESGSTILLPSISFSSWSISSLEVLCILTFVDAPSMILLRSFSFLMRG